MEKVIKSFHQPTGEQRRFPSGANPPAGEPESRRNVFIVSLMNSFIVFLLAPLLVLSYTFSINPLDPIRKRRKALELYEAIARRRTIRGFTRAVPEETLRRIIMAGAMAASPINLQPWEFIIIDDPKLIEQIAEHKYRQNQKIFPGPPALAQKNAYKNCSVVAVCYKKGHGNHWCAWMCIQNMALAATAEGLGIVPSELWAEDQVAVETLLGLPADYKLAAVVLIGRQKGYPKPPKVKRRPEWGWLHRNRFGVKQS